MPHDVRKPRMTCHFWPLITSYTLLFIVGFRHSTQGGGASARHYRYFTDLYIVLNLLHNKCTFHWK
jgi:hypothetical protein